MLWKCENPKCGCLFAVGLAACPECGGTRVTVHDVEGSPNPVLSTVTGEPIAAKRKPSGGQGDGQQGGQSDVDAGK